jgi:Mn-dependent DtxR family transcriptional regulator
MIVDVITGDAEVLRTLIQLNDNPVDGGAPDGPTVAALLGIATPDLEASMTRLTRRGLVDHHEDSHGPRYAVTPAGHRAAAARHLRW